MTRLAFLLALAAAFAQDQPKPPDRCREAIETALHDKNPDTRLQAVVALSLSSAGHPWTETVAGMLDDKDVQVRVAAVSSLVDLKGPDAKKALHKALNDDVPEVAFAAARALYSLGDPAGKDALLAVLAGEMKTKSGFFTTQKRDAMRMMHTPRTLFLFVLKTGAGFVPLPGFGAGVSSMEAIVNDPGTSGRAAAALLLGKEKDAVTQQALKDALADSNWSVRAAAVHSIALRNDPSQKNEILPLLDDKTQAVRLRAAVGWLRLDSIGSARRRARKPAQKS